MTQKVLISDTTLRSLILPQVPKSTPKLRQLCGCELCIIPKDMQVDINGSRTRVIIYLQQTSFGIHTCNSLFSATSAAYYKEKVFPYGECLQDTTKDAADCITCYPIKPKNMINMNCALGFCHEFLE